LLTKAARVVELISCVKMVVQAAVANKVRQVLVALQSCLVIKAKMVAMAIQEHPAEAAVVVVQVWPAQTQQAAQVAQAVLVQPIQLPVHQ
jgi:hypothetical protein